MRVSPQTLLRGLAKLVAVVVVSAAVGVGLGYGLSELKGNAGAADTSAFTPAGATGASGATDDGGGLADDPDADPDDPDAAGQAGVTLRIVSAVLTPATTPSGRERRRARLTVRVRATNAGDEAVRLSSAVIAADGDEQEADPAAANAAGALLEPIDGGESATGELRFETAGALTDTLTQAKRATLRVANADDATVRLTVDRG